MHVIHAPVTGRQGLLFVASCAALKNSRRRCPAAARGSVCGAVVAAWLAASTLAFGGAVAPNWRAGTESAGENWIVKVGRHHRSLGLTRADVEGGGLSASGKRQSRAFTAGGDSGRSLPNVGVPEGTINASLTSRGPAIDGVGGLLSAVPWVDARRFLIGDAADGILELRKAEAALLGGASAASAYSTYTASASASRDAERFLGLAAPVFGSRLRVIGRPTVTMRTFGAAGADGGVVPVGTGDESGRRRPSVHPSTAAVVPTAAGDVFSAILGNGGGLMVWQLSRRRSRRSRGPTAVAG